ncbi:ABC transporter substrate-binding protein [Mesobacillus maritimus]|uniref:ABC transporter substrate-binding protein n=1 Tax=Mesobacillus maritimus TaxID=1643336 RepID=UPI00203B1856|nr:ABC transporter substrate-binding protein [Mesobacillus maritimus]MCM3586635.1 ABC transporter substrate-binding protein [Mesobacillus maritimus]MCM3668612.1 ABC transporter substrate-binding protein [Mesobacillus maritimus]
MNNNKLCKWLAGIFLLLFLAGCQSNETSLEETPKATETEAYSVVDDRGKEILFEKTPETVVSLQPSNTEILFEIGVGDKVIGVTEFDNFPEEVSEIEVVSDTVVFNAERIIELDPDVVIAYTIGDENAITPLEEAGIPVFVIESASAFEDVYSDIKQISKVMGVEETGEELVANIQSRIEDVKKTGEVIESAKKVYLEISPAPEIFTTGKNTFQQEILDHAGVENVFLDQEGWIKLSEEDVIKRNPEIIATTVYYTEDPLAEIKGRNGWNEIQAIQNEQVFQLDGDILSRPGPRIAEAVEMVAEMAYPELYK